MEKDFHFWPPGEENGNPLQYSCLENSTDRGGLQPMGSQTVRHNRATYPSGHHRETFPLKIIKLDETYEITVFRCWTTSKIWSLKGEKWTRWAWKYFIDLSVSGRKQIRVQGHWGSWNSHGMVLDRKGLGNLYKYTIPTWKKCYKEIKGVPEICTGALLNLWLKTRQQMHRTKLHKARKRQL